MKIIHLSRLALLSLLLTGCSDDSDSNTRLSPETEELLRTPQELVEAAKALPEFIRVAPGFFKAIYSSLRELHASVAEDDYEKARATAATIDRVLKSSTFSWYVKILAIEESDSVTAALSLVEEFGKKEDITDTEQEALKHFETFLHKKGEIKSLDALLLVSAAALESKYGKGAGVALLALQHPVRPSEFSSVALKAILEAELSGETNDHIYTDAEQ